MKEKLKQMITGIAALAAASVFATVDLDSGLVTWFSFDEADSSGTNVVNRADASRPLSIVSGAMLDQDDAIGGASLSFSGEQMQMAMFTSPPLANCTVSFWFRRGENDGPYVVANNVANPYLFSQLGNMHCNLPHNLQRLTFLDRNWTSMLLLENSAPPAAWMHYLFTVSELSREDGKSTMEGKLYIGGYLRSVTTNTVNGIQPSTSTTTTLLGNISSGGRPPMFKMDEFRVWNRVLSDEEAYAEYARMSGYDKGTLVAYWDMDGIDTSSGTPTVADKSATGLYPLTLGSAVTVTSDAVEGNALSFVNSSSSWGSTKFNRPLTDMTFALWIKPAADTSATAPRVFDGLGSGYVHANPDRNNFSLTVKDPCATSAFTFDSATQPWCIDKGAWSHLALVRKCRRQGDGTYLLDVLMYVNGVKMAERTDIAITSPFFSDSAALYLFNMDGKSRPMDALGDEIRVYSGALSGERIAAIYSGASAVSAGTDFYTTGDTAVLRGRVGTDSGDPFRSGYCGTVAWSLVSAPVGGESVAFARGANPETEVTLPVVGEYVFRLSVSTEGFERYDDVTVTRVASASGPTPVLSASAQATVTLPLKGWVKANATNAESIWWRKVSGPGGVWFDVDNLGNGHAFFSAAGAYVLSCHAENAAGSVLSEVSVSVETGDVVDVPSANLERHFAFNTNNVWKESVQGGTPTGSAELVPGMKMFGFRVMAANSSYNNSASTWETRANPTSASLVTAPDYLTFSAWMKYEPDTDTNDSELPFIMINHQSCCLRMGRAKGNASTGIVDDGEGLTLCQQNGGGASMSGLTCDFDGLASITGRWTHVCAIFPRTGGERDNFEIWIDGVKRTLTAVSGYGGFPRPARDVEKIWKLGGYNGKITSNYNLFANATNRVDGGYKSNTFPGSLDEVRFYSAKLTPTQIRALANERDATRNFAPAMDVSAPRRVTRLTELPISLGVYDDGLPSGGTLACSWEVVFGDASAVSFGDETSAATTVRFRKEGRYHLQLVASDGERTSYSDPMVVDVVPRGSVFIMR